MAWQEPRSNMVYAGGTKMTHPSMIVWKFDFTFLKAWWRGAHGDLVAWPGSKVPMMALWPDGLLLVAWWPGVQMTWRLVT